MLTRLRVHGTDARLSSSAEHLRAAVRGDEPGVVTSNLLRRGAQSRHPDLPRAGRGRKGVGCEVTCAGGHVGGPSSSSGKINLSALAAAFHVVPRGAWGAATGRLCLRSITSAPGPWPRPHWQRKMAPVLVAWSPVRTGDWKPGWLYILILSKTVTSFVPWQCPPRPRRFVFMTQLAICLGISSPGWVRSPAHDDEEPLNRLLSTSPSGGAARVP